jgi:hypothetical protein
VRPHWAARTERWSAPAAHTHAAFRAAAPRRLRPCSHAARCLPPHAGSHTLQR